MEQKYNESQTKIQLLGNEIIASKIHGETALKTLLETCIKSSGNLANHAISDNEISVTAGTPGYFMIIAEELKDTLMKIVLVHENYLEDNNNVESLARKVILGGHLLASVHIQGMAICNQSADIEQGERKWFHNLIKFTFNIT